MGFESVLVKVILLVGFIMGLILIIPTKKRKENDHDNRDTESNN
jgi:hypothetical protein